MRSLHRAVDILLCFKTVGPELGVAEISRACVLDKSTASRIAGDLCERQFLQRDPHSGKYRLGPQLLALAEAARGHIDLRREALPHMRWLWEQLGETIRLSVVRGMERVCIEQIESRHELRRVIELNRPFPMHAGSSGKVLLAHLPPEMQAAILDAPLTAFTERTITSPERLRANLEQVRAQGHCIASGERAIGGFSMAVPVWDYSGRVVASLSMSAPETRRDPARIEGWLEDLKTAASRISISLGFDCPQQEPSRQLQAADVIVPGGARADERRRE